MGVCRGGRVCARGGWEEGEVAKKGEEEGWEGRGNGVCQRRMGKGGGGKEGEKGGGGEWCVPGEDGERGGRGWKGRGGEGMEGESVCLCMQLPVYAFLSVHWVPL